MSTREEVEQAIREAFAGVTLGDGTSLSRAEWADSWGRIPDDEVAQRQSLEVVDDWTRIPDADLDRNNFPFLDVEGLRYFLPALMLRILREYVPSEMWCTSAVLLLTAPRADAAFIAFLTPEQRRAIALFVRELPNLVPLDKYDAPEIAHAFRDVWAQHVPPGSKDAHGDRNS